MDSTRSNGKFENARENRLVYKIGIKERERERIVFSLYKIDGQSINELGQVQFNSIPFRYNLCCDYLVALN